MKKEYIEPSLEVFKEIEEFPGYYAGDLGHIMSTKGKEPRILKSKTEKNGYLRVQLCKQGKRFDKYVHVLIVEAYLGARPDVDYEVDHINGIKNDNRLENLHWMTHQANSEKANAKKVICIETGEIYDSAAKASLAIGLNDAAVSQAISRKTRAGGYHWAYLED